MFLRIAKISLLLLVFSLCYIQPFVPLFGFQTAPTEFIFLFTGALWLLSIFAKQSAFRFHRFIFLLLFYFAAMLASAILSDDPRTSFAKLAGEIYLLLLPVLIYNLVESEDDLRRLILVWLGGTVAAIAVGTLTILVFYLNQDCWLLDYTVHHYGAVPVGNYPRLRANFLSPSLFCNYLSVSFALLLIAFEMNWVRGGFAVVFAAFLFLNAAFTISSGLGGLVLIAGLWIYRNGGGKSFSRLCLCAGLLTAIFFWAVNFVALEPHQTAPYTIRIFGDEFYPSPRLMIWQASLQTFWENFFFGRGVGQDSCRVIFQSTDGSLALYTDAHNIYLSVASQAGVFGFLAIVSIIFYSIKTNLRHFLTPDKSSSIPAILLIAFVAAFVYQGLLGSFEDARHLWVLIGLLAAANESAHRAK